MLRALGCGSALSAVGSSFRPHFFTPTNNRHASHAARVQALCAFVATHAAYPPLQRWWACQRLSRQDKARWTWQLGCRWPSHSRSIRGVCCAVAKGLLLTWLRAPHYGRKGSSPPHTPWHPAGRQGGRNSVRGMCVPGTAGEGIVPRACRLLHSQSGIPGCATNSCFPTAVPSTRSAGLPSAASGTRRGAAKCFSGRGRGRGTLPSVRF